MRAAPTSFLPQSRLLRRFLIYSAVGISLLLILLLAVFLMIYGAENGWAGESAQNWVRAQKSRFVFNQLYALKSPPIDSAPNAFLVESVRNFKPGTALDIAAGNGRNSVFLAEEGWQVTAFDVSEIGLSQARSAAKQKGVPLETVEATFHSFDYGKDRWDLVVLVYVSVRYDDRELLHRIQDSIKPGGYLLIESPLMMHQDPTISPRIPGDLRKGELPSLWPGLETVHYREAEETTDFFRIRALVGHYLARKPINRPSLTSARPARSAVQSIGLVANSMCSVAILRIGRKRIAHEPARCPTVEFSNRWIKAGGFSGVRGRARRPTSRYSDGFAS